MVDLEKRSKSEWLYTIMIAIVIGGDYIALVIMNKLASFIPLVSITGKQLLYGIFGILFLVHFKEIINNLIRKNATDVLFVCALFICSSIALAIFPHENQLYNDENITSLFLLYLPAYIMVRSISDYDAIANRMYVVACVFFIFSSYALSDSVVHLEQGYDTNMSLGFQFSFCTLIFADTFLEREVSKLMKVVSLILSVISISMVFSIGSRGSAIVCLLYLLYEFLHKTKHIGLIPRVFMSMVIIMFGVFFDDIKSMLLSVLGTTLQQSRTLAWIFQTDARLDTSGRNEIFLKVIEAIKKQPIIGYGIYGDRAILGWTYTHNFILEIIVDFGIPIGLTFVLVYFIRLLRGLKTENAQRFISIVGLYATGMLIVSSSYLQTGVFWVALGAIMSMRGRVRIILGKKSNRYIHPTTEKEIQD